MHVYIISGGCRGWSDREGEGCNAVHETSIADPHRFLVTISRQRSGVATALATENLSTVATVMPPPHHSESGCASHTLRSQFIWNPCGCHNGGMLSNSCMLVMMIVIKMSFLWLSLNAVNLSFDVRWRVINSFDRMLFIQRWFGGDVYTTIFPTAPII